MKTKKIPDENAPEPIFQLNEFEEAAGAILDLAKDQAEIKLEQANQQREHILADWKKAMPDLEKKYSDKLQEEIGREKEKLRQKAKEELEKTQNVPVKKTKQAVQYVLEKILP